MTLHRSGLLDWPAGRLFLLETVSKESGLMQAAGHVTLQRVDVCRGQQNRPGHVFTNCTLEMKALGRPGQFTNRPAGPVCQTAMHHWCVCARERACVLLANRNHMF